MTQEDFKKLGLENFDDVLITGRSTSPLYDFVDLKATVATVSWDALKVWPWDGQPNPGNGKAWFPIENIKEVKITSKWHEEHQGSKDNK